METVYDKLIPIGSKVSVYDFTVLHDRLIIRLKVLPDGSEFRVMLRHISKNDRNVFAAYHLGTVILKAGWNFGLITRDNSLGIHNPTFTDKILQNTYEIITSDHK